MLIATSTLIYGFYKFKELRRQPGDIILGIAVSDFVLALHWLSIAINPDGVNNPNYCLGTGSVGTFVGATEYFYNIAFNIYLILSLRNALKQDKIPKKSIHVGVLTASLLTLIFLLHGHKIGKTFVKTCSIIARCDQPVINYIWPPATVMLYVILGSYTYLYVKKNAPRCANSNAQRAKFLLYYLKYIMASTIVYAFICFLNILSPIMNNNLPGSIFTEVTNSLYNISRLGSPLILSIVRFRDPFIQRILKKAIFGERALDSTKSLGVSLIAGEVVDQQQTEIQIKSAGDEENDNQFIFNQLQSTRKVEITYTLLSCVLFGEQTQRSTIRGQETVAERKANNLYKHEIIYHVSDDIVKAELPQVKKELNKNSINIMPGTLKAYAPEVFTQFLNEDKDYLDLQASLDFHENAEEISECNGPGGGRSGEFFFFSKDKKLIVKTIPDIEMKALVSMLKEYEEHFKTNPRTLIAKIYGAFTFASAENGENYHIIIMKNLSGFPSSFVKRCYDMKGSRYEREVLNKGQPVESKADLKQYGVLKDIDFEKHEKKLYIKDELKADFLRQIDIDSTFFQRVKLIDYSFMVFCIDKKQFEDQNGALNDGFTAKNPLGSLENTQEPGMYYNVGIVDYLQPYNFQKQFEKILKKVKKFDVNLETSTQDPQYYSTRFIAFMSALIEQSE